jgi:hypothetical protein
MGDIHIYKHYNVWDVSKVHLLEPFVRFSFVVSNGKIMTVLSVQYLHHVDGKLQGLVIVNIIC